MPSALVVGPHSMLGNRLGERLREMGWRVISVGRSADCEVQLDLGSDSLRLDCSGFSADVLFHCAAAFGDDSPQGAWLNEQVNVLGCHQILALAQSAGCERVVYAGSVSSAGIGMPSDLSAYGASKARAEQVLSWGLTRHGQGFTSLRFAQLYDERGECIRHQRWFGRIVSYARQGLSLRLPPGEALRNFVHVHDAVQAMIAVAQGNLNGVLHVCHPQSDSYLSLARQAYDVFGRGGEVVIAGEKIPFHEAYFPTELSGLELSFTSMNEGLVGIRDGGYIQRFEVFDVD